MKPKSKILIIAGSDSSGGAGIQADIKTITSLGSFAMTAVTAITVQNTLGVKSVIPIPVDEIKNQIISEYKINKKELSFVPGHIYNKGYIYKDHFIFEKKKLNDFAIFIGANEDAQSVAVAGMSFVITAKTQATADKTATITIIGNETGGSTTINLTVKKLTTQTAGGN